MDRETTVKSLFQRLRENPLIICLGIGIGILSSMNSIGIMQSVQEWLGFKMITAEIEVTRRAAAAVPCNTTIVGFSSIVYDALITNKRIAHEQESRRHWWSWIMSPWWWNSVRPIDMPCSSRSDIRMVNVP